MSRVVLLLLDLGEWLGKLYVWLADDPQATIGTSCVLFVISSSWRGLSGLAHRRSGAR